MKKRMLTSLLCIGMVAALAACGTDMQPIGGTNAGDDPERNVLPVAPIGTDIGEEEMSGEKEITAEEMAQLKNGMNGFAFRLYDALPGDGNRFYSPYSLCSALAMLNVGADGETKKEIEETLGITDFEEWNKEMQAYLSKNWTDDTFVTTANSLWMAKDGIWAENMEQDFATPVQRYYKGEVYEADFASQPESVVKEINRWTSEKTEGMIEKIVSDIPENTVLMLLNAVYFEGKWEIPFDKDDTYEGTFHGKDADSTADMMRMYGERFRYTDNGSIKGISIPYEGGSVQMKIFLPSDENAYIGDLLKNLSAEEKQELLDSLDNGSYEDIARLEMPKFTDEEELEGLDGILQDMGIRSAYTEGADFSKIADNVALSTVIHKAKVIVDEQGTKAAAVTGAMVEMTALVEPEPEITFIADRPFFYVIEDADTGMILFMGQMNNMK